MILDCCEEKIHLKEFVLNHNDSHFVLIKIAEKKRRTQSEKYLISYFKWKSLLSSFPKFPHYLCVFCRRLSFPPSLCYCHCSRRTNWNDMSFESKIVSISSAWTINICRFIWNIIWNSFRDSFIVHKSLKAIIVWKCRVFSMVFPAISMGGLVFHVFLLRTTFIQFHRRLFEKVIMILLLGSVASTTMHISIWKDLSNSRANTLIHHLPLDFFFPLSQYFPYCLSLSLYRSQCFSHKIHYDNIFVIKCMIIGLFFPFVTSMLTPYHLL